MKEYRCLKDFWFDDLYRKKDEIITSTPEATEMDRSVGNLAEEVATSKKEAASAKAVSTRSTSKPKSEADK